MIQDFRLQKQLFYLLNDFEQLLDTLLQIEMYNIFYVYLNAGSVILVKNNLNHSPLPIISEAYLKATSILVS